MIIGAGLVAIVGAGVYLLSSSSPQREVETKHSTGSADLRAAPDVTPAEVDPSATIPPQAAIPPEPPAVRIDQILEKLRAGKVSVEELDAFRRAMLEGDAREAIAAIRQFLASGRDAPTGEPFTPGGRGQLETAPTLRVLLLDVLGVLDRQAGTGESAEISREVLQKRTSPDEWAISLRNVAWQEPQSHAYLSTKMREMLTHRPWMEEPSGGLLEAFDVIVHTRDASFLPTLAEFVEGENPELNRAAGVALDRFSQAAPLEVMSFLNNHPGALAQRPFVRADFFAAADVAQEGQRQAFEAYLSRPDVSLEEKTKALQALAVPTSFVSENLLTVSPPPVPAEDLKRREGLAKVAESWLASGRFPELQPAIRELNATLKP